MHVSCRNSESKASLSKLLLLHTSKRTEGGSQNSPAKVVQGRSKRLQNFTGDEDVNSNVITHSDSSVKTPDNSLYNALMGLEECDKKGESCLKRRMVEEAHLEYIYTQHHKP
ncbi:hypothetical protein LguiA_016005 [Lonicera macranthoides]